jgi:hypothetical protein
MSSRRFRAISRRSFVRGALGLTAAAGLAAAAGGSLLGRSLPASPAQRLASIVAHRESAVAVGREVLRVRPAEADIPVLLAALGASVPDLPRLLDQGSDDELRVALDRASRRDFAAAGDGLVRVQGWVASRTEARVCAIIALA